MPDPGLLHTQTLNCPHGNAWRAKAVVQAGRTYILTIQVETVYALVVTDVTDPANPFVAAWIGWGDLDGTAVRKEIGYVYGLEVNAAGTRAYVGHAGLVTVLDISALPAVTNVGGGTTPLQWSSGLGTPPFLSRDGNNLFVGLASSGLYRLDISNPNAITQTGFLGPITADDGRYLPLSNVVTTAGGVHVLGVMPPNRVVLVDVTGTLAVLSTVTCQTGITPNTVTSRAERAIQTGLLTPTRLYTVEGTATPPAGDSALNKSTVYARSIDVAEGGSLATPLLLGQSATLEPEILDLLEITRLGRRYLVGTAYLSWFGKTIAGVASRFSGRTAVILDVETPASISLVSVLGPLYAGKQTDYFNPAYQAYASIMVGNTLITTSYGFGLVLNDLTTLASPVYLSRVLLSGEGRVLARRGNLLAAGDASSTMRLYDLVDPEHPAQRGAYYSSSQVFQLGIALPDGTPNHALVVGITSTVLEIVNVADWNNPALTTLLTIPFAMQGVAAQGTLAVVWGWSGSLLPAFSLIDLANPAVPVIRSTTILTTSEARSGQCILDGSLLYFPTTGNNDGSGGIRIYNVANPAAPVLLGSVLGDPANAALLVPVNISVMALMKSGNRRFLYTLPTYDSLPSALVLSRGGLWGYEVTDPSNPVLVSHIGHAVMFGSNARVICGQMVVVGGWLLIVEYYAGVLPVDISDGLRPAALAAGGYFNNSQFSFGVAANGTRLYVLRISSLEVFDSTILLPPAAPSPPTALFYFSEAADAGSVGAGALTNAWMEVRSPDGAALLAEASGTDLLNVGEGFYDAHSLPWPVGSTAVMTRFHTGQTPDSPSQRVRNLIEFAGALD